MQPVSSPDWKWLAILLTDGSTTDIWEADHWSIDAPHHPLRPPATLITRRAPWLSD
jgi:hypothetical protein